MQNLHRIFDRYYIGKIYGGDFAKICGLLRIYELYQNACSLNKLCTFCHQMLLFVPIPKLLAVNKATLSVCKCAAATYFGTVAFS